MKHWLLILACLTGCASAPEIAPPDVAKTGYGMFVGLGPVIETRLAEEAAQQFWRTYPAPRYLLNFQQRTANTDSFARLLINALQRDGYFVRQWFDPAVTPECDKSDKKATDRKSGDFRITPVCYLVDDVSGLLRLTLYVAGDSWSRFFTEERGKLVPAGAWTQQKGE